MKTRILTVLTTLAFLGFSVSTFAGKDCVDGDTRPKCNPGGGGDDHGDPPAQYYVELTEGGFYFDGQVVTRNNRGNSYNSTEGLVMNQGGPFPGGYDADIVAWEEVFDTCPTAYPDDYPRYVEFGDDWSIDNAGGKTKGEIDSRVTLAFRNGYDPEYSEVEFDLFLWGLLPEPGIPASSGETVSIPLENFSFYVHAHGNDSCKIIGEFVDGVDSILKMTWYDPPNP